MLGLNWNVCVNCPYCHKKMHLILCCYFNILAKSIAIEMAFSTLMEVVLEFCCSCDDPGRGNDLVGGELEGDIFYWTTYMAGIKLNQFLNAIYSSSGQVGIGFAWG